MTFYIFFIIILLTKLCDEKKMCMIRVAIIIENIDNMLKSVIIKIKIVFKIVIIRIFT